jgi:hypothetical protein
MAKGIFDRVFGGSNTEGEQPKPVRKCPEGHSMDPSWDACPYCAGSKPVAPPPQPELAGNDDQRPKEPKRRDTQINSGGVAHAGRVTKVDRGEDAPHPRVGSGNSHGKIVGVLVTFTWHPQHGELFVLYEGKNFIGSGNVGTEAGQPCDILIRTDSQLSSEHALILCRQGRYELFDQRSTNGTFLDGKFVEAQGASLSQSAIIKTGATIWKFLRIEVGPSEAVHPRQPDTGAEVSKPDGKQGESKVS